MITQSLPLPAEPDSTRFGCLNCAGNFLLSAGKLEALGNNLFTATLDSTAANYVTSSSEFVISHRLGIVGEIGDSLLRF